MAKNIAELHKTDLDFVVILEGELPGLPFNNVGFFFVFLFVFCFFFHQEIML